MSVTIRALWYVETHLSTDISLDTIADALGVSRFHVSRVFNMTFGRSLVGYARARRLSVAAQSLASCTSRDILSIALDCGYGSQEAFTRAFRQQFGVTPGEVRAQATTDGLSLQGPVRLDESPTTPLGPPRVERLNTLRLLGVAEHYRNSSNTGIPAQWSRLTPHVGHIEGQRGHEMFGVIYNTDDSGNYDYLCGVEVETFPSRPASFSRLTIPPQRYAVFEHPDHISSVASTWMRIWDDALARTPLAAAEGPAFERFDARFDGRTGLGGLEIWIPISN